VEGASDQVNNFEPAHVVADNHRDSAGASLGNPERFGLFRVKADDVVSSELVKGFGDVTRTSLLDTLLVFVRVCGAYIAANGLRIVNHRTTAACKRLAQHRSSCDVLVVFILSNVRAIAAFANVILTKVFRIVSLSISQILVSIPNKEGIAMQTTAEFVPITQDKLAAPTEGLLRVGADEEDFGEDQADQAHADCPENARNEEGKRARVHTPLSPLLSIIAAIRRELLRDLLVVRVSESFGAAPGALKQKPAEERIQNQEDYLPRIPSPSLADFFVRQDGFNFSVSLVRCHKRSATVLVH